MKQKNYEQSQDFTRILKEELQLMMDTMQSHLKVNLWESFIMARYLSFVGMKNQQEIL